LWDNSQDSPTRSGQQYGYKTWLHSGGRRSLIQLPTHQPVKEVWPNVFSASKRSARPETEPGLARPCSRDMHRPRTRWRVCGLQKPMRVDSSKREPNSCSSHSTPGPLSLLLQLNKQSLGCKWTHTK
jgi:hypothetical protein